MIFHLRIINGMIFNKFKLVDLLIDYSRLGLMICLHKIKVNNNCFLQQFHYFKAAKQKRILYFCAVYHLNTYDESFLPADME